MICRYAQKQKKNFSTLCLGVEKLELKMSIKTTNYRFDKKDIHRKINGCGA